MVKDHLGNEYKSIKEMCMRYGVNFYTFKSRRKHGLSLKESLAVESKRNHLVYDHEGNSFSSYKEMCAYWNVSIDTFNKRKRRNMLLEECLTGENCFRGKRCAEESRTDYLGNVYETAKDMYEKYNIDSQTFRQRKLRGLSLEECLLGEKNPVKAGRKCKDHLGNCYNTIKDMCDTWGVTTFQYYHRKKSGYSLKECLEYKKEEVFDHLGIKYDSKVAMCRHYGISEGTLDTRLKNGFSLEESLTTPSEVRLYPNQIVIDHEGKKFMSVADMCRSWGIPESSYYSRMKLGWSIKDTLLTPIKHRYMNGWKILYSVFQCNDESYYMCIKGEQEEVLTLDEIKSS